MPTIKTVSVTYGRKHNLGDFCSAHVEISIWADVTEEDDLDAIMRNLWTMAKENVRVQLLPLVSNHNAKVEEAFLGLPRELKEAIDVANQGPH